MTGNYNPNLQLNIAIIDSSDTWYAQPKLIYDELIKLGHNVLWLARPNNQGFKKNNVPPGFIKICIANNLSPIDVFTDKPMELNHPPLERAFYSDADLIFVGDKNIFLKYFSSRPNAYYLPYAVNTGVFKNLDIPELYDVGFIGNIKFEARKRRIEKLKQHFKVFTGTKLFMEDANLAMNQCKIIFNTCDGKEINMRVFEALATGKLLITEKIEFLDELFTDREHLITYADDSELIEVVRHYLSDENERKKIAECGLIETSKKHTYLHRAKYIIEKIYQSNIKYDYKNSKHVKSEKKYRSFYENQSLTNRSAQDRIFDFSLPDPDSDGMYDIRNRLKAALKIAKGKVLDVGCQRGGYSFNLKNIGCDVTAIDISLGYIKQAKNKVKGISVAQSNAEFLPFKENTFDTVILSEVLEHVTDEKKVVDGVRRILKTNGEVFVTVPAYEDDSEEHVRFLSKKSLAKLFEDFRIEFRDDYNLKSTILIAKKPELTSVESKINGRKFNILLTNHHLLDLTGSEIYTFTLAEQLSKNGHSVTIYSKYVDKTKLLFDNIGLRIVENLDEIKNIRFDIAHVHHNINAMEVRNTFPNLPIVFLAHGVLPFLEQAPSVDLNISKFLAVSEEIKDNLTLSGIPDRDISILGNMVDEIKFLSNKSINAVPQNALVISGRIDELKESVIRMACEALNIRVKFVGGRFGELKQKEIKELIEEADIVFSLGRGAIEAMFMGRIAIIFDYLGGDGIITEHNFHEIKKCNFSGRRYKHDFSVNDLISEIKKYDSSQSDKLRRLALDNFSATKLTNRLLTHYVDALNIKPEPLDQQSQKLLDHFICTINETRNYSFEISARKNEKPVNNDQTEDRLRRAEQLIENNQFDDAKIILTEMLQTDPLDLNALNNLSVIYVLENNLTAAESLASLILQIDPSNEVALGNLDYIKQSIVLNP